MLQRWIATLAHVNSEMDPRMATKKRTGRLPKKAQRLLRDALSGDRPVTNISAELDRLGVSAPTGLEELVDRLSALLIAPDDALATALAGAPRYVVEAAIQVLCRRKQASALAMLADRLPGRDNQKLLAGAMHALSAQGIEVPSGEREPVSRPRRHSVSSEALEAWSSVPYDGRFLVAVFVPRQGYSQMLYMVASETAGIDDVEILESSARAARRELRNPGMNAGDDVQPSFRVPVAYAMFLAEDAIAKARNLGRRIRPDVLSFCREIREHWGVVPDEHALVGPVQVDPITMSSERADEVGALVYRGSTLGWVLDEEPVLPFLVRVLEVGSSPIVVSEEVEQRRIRDISDEGLRATFTPDVRRLFARRLEHLAAWLDESRERELATAALGSASALRRQDIAVDDIAFAKAFFQVHFTAFVQRMVERIAGAQEGAGDAFDESPDEQAAGAEKTRIILP